MRARLLSSMFYKTDRQPSALLNQGENIILNFVVAIFFRRHLETITVKPLKAAIRWAATPLWLDGQLPKSRNYSQYNTVNKIFI